MKDKPSILLFIKVPPPTTGATLMNKRVYDSRLLQKHFCIRSICISYSENLLQMGHLSLKKILKIKLVFLSLLKELLFHKPNFIYFQISPLQLGFYRDLLFVLLIKLFKTKIVYHIHVKGISEHCANQPWKRKIYKCVFKGEDIICLSHFLTYDVKDFFQGKIHIVNNGIPDIDEVYRRKRKDSSCNETRIVFCNRKMTPLCNRNLTHLS